MGWFESFGFTSAGNADEFPTLDGLDISNKDFISIDVSTIYSKILTDVIERSQGLSEENQKFLWDNCLASEKNKGLISLLADAMARKDELFLVLDKATKVLRKATQEEMVTIQADYKAKAESSVGTYISFKGYTRTDMVKLYSGFEYLTLCGLHKTMNISKAMQVKISDLRASTSLTDSADAKAQAKKIAQGLKDGKDVMLDAKDSIETAKPDLTATNASFEMVNEKRAFYLGMPASYITGDQPSTMGDSGKGDAKAVERGLKAYFFSIVKPTIKAIFGTDLSFKSDDADQITSSTEVLKTFDVTSQDFISAENKTKIVNKLFQLPDDAKGDPPEKNPPGDPNAPQPGKAIEPGKAPPGPKAFGS